MDIDNKKIDEFIKNLKNHTCPLCDSKQWIINDKVFFLLEYDTKAINFGGAAYPVIPLTCPKCGNTILINVVIAGLLDINANIQKSIDKDKGNNNKDEKSAK